MNLLKHMRDYDPGERVDSPGKADYALTVKGDGMNPTYQDGDIIYIHEQPTLDYDGQVAVIILEDCATVKHVWGREGSVMLTSDNPACAPIYSNLDSIRILGKVCGFTRMYREAQDLTFPAPAATM